MLVQITHTQSMQHAGCERALCAGSVVEVSDVVGASLLRRKVARVVTAPAETRERAVIVAPETAFRRGRR